MEMTIIASLKIAARSILWDDANEDTWLSYCHYTTGSNSNLVATKRKLNNHTMPSYDDTMKRHSSTRRDRRHRCAAPPAAFHCVVVALFLSRSWITPTTTTARCMIALIFLATLGNVVSSFTTTTTATTINSKYRRVGWPATHTRRGNTNTRSRLVQDHNDNEDQIPPLQESPDNDRRYFLQRYMMMMVAATSTAGTLTGTTAASAASDDAVVVGSSSSSSTSSSATAEITDKIYIMIKGLKSGNAEETITTASGSVQPKQPQQPTPRRIVIGLFGKDAPQSVANIKALMDNKNGGGLAAPCKPRDTERALQKEQLEANKVYNACIETQAQGVTLRYSSIWRIVPNVRIDLGAVSGKFVAREYPTFDEEESILIKNRNNLKHDTPGVVSVRRGNDGGFGFTIYPGGGSATTTTTAAAASVAYLDEDHIVVGRVLSDDDGGESMDVVRELNAVPVIASSKALNYMALTGGTTTKNAPNRSCRYGGPMYCNENKPLLKLSITETGIL